jgi:hypothetical protein
MPWYYYNRGRREGPIEDDAMRRMAARGALKPTDLVWRPGMKDWAYASTVPGLLQPPPTTLQSQAEEGPPAPGQRSALPTPAPQPVFTYVATVTHTESRSNQPEASKPSNPRETESPQQAWAREPATPIPSTRVGECPRCAFLLPETAFFLEDYRCPACGSSLDPDAGQTSRVPTNKPGPSTLAEQVPNSEGEEAEVQTPGVAYPLAILSGFVGAVCGALVPFFALPSGKSTLVEPALLLGLTVSLGLVGWLFGRKWPALGGRWTFWIAGPLVALTLLTGGTKIVHEHGVLGVAELIGYLGALFCLLIPAAVGARLGSRKAIKASSRALR